MAQIFTAKNGSILVMDGTTPTPYGVILKFENGDLTAPLGRMKPRERLIMEHGQATASMHYVTDGDIEPMAPVPISFSAFILDSEPFTTLNAVCGNVLSLYTAGTWANAKGIASAFTIFNPYTDIGAGTRTKTVTTVGFADSTKKAVHIEVIWQTDDTGPVAFKVRYEECYFDLNNQNFTEGMDGVILHLSGECYGAIELTKNTAFTTTSAPTLA